MPKRKERYSGTNSNPLSDARLFKKDAGGGKKPSNSSSSSTSPATAAITATATTTAKTSSSNNNTNNNNSSKADQNAQSLWHRKSGAGFSLFLSYYGSQPLGVVCAAAAAAKEDAKDDITATITHTTNTSLTTVASEKGMSRAAKKRRKQKQQKSINDTTIIDKRETASKNSTGGIDVAQTTLAATAALTANATASSQQQQQHRQQSQSHSIHNNIKSHPLLQAYNTLIISQSKTNKKQQQQQQQLLLHPQFESFVHALSRPLPLTFRFRRHDASNDPTILLPSSNNSTVDKEQQQQQISNLVAPVSYDPTQTIYQSTPNNNNNSNNNNNNHTLPISKSNLSKLSPSLKEFLVAKSMNGTLARQELGSMLPVLCLEALGALGAGSKVLDLCASPGSKTLQALELVASGGGGGGGGGGGNGSGAVKRKKRGRVIANDIHPGRLDALQKAVLRSGLPAAMTSRITYTNYDASSFPRPPSGKLFHAVLCDVPCSGDGTIRKDEHILPNWIPRTGNALHGLQLRILARALELVKVGGFVCYSTCSLNPVEDEAVVTAALRRVNHKKKKGGGKNESGFTAMDEGDESADSSAAVVELVHWPEGLLPGFIRRPGVTDWNVAFYDQNTMEEDNDDFGSLTFCKTYEEAVEAGMEDAQATFWPEASKDNGLQLDRCVRLFPQDHDSGGFFVALLRRLK